MPLVLTSPLWHVARAGHPERAERLSVLEPLWRGRSVLEIAARPDILEATRTIHAPGLVRQVEEACALGLDLDADTPTSPATWEAVLAAQEAARAAVRLIAAGEAARVFVPARPPGHHATHTRAMGFCLFNHIALAAHLASHHLDLSPVLIVDFDVHHGNGTQDIFYQRDDVFFFSMHQSPLFPGTGYSDESGDGPGEGWTRNLPLLPFTNRQVQVQRFVGAMDEIEARIRPRLVLISAGFDAHAADPLAQMELLAEDFATITRRICELADRHARGRVISFLEGGYDLTALKDSVERHLHEMDRAPGASAEESGGSCDAPAPDVPGGGA